MVNIINLNHSVRIDLLAFTELETVRYDTVYVLKDKVVEIKVAKGGEWVEILTDRSVYQLDMKGVHGLPAKVGGKVPSDNYVLAEELRKIRAL